MELERLDTTCTQLNLLWYDSGLWSWQFETDFASKVKRPGFDPKESYKHRWTGVWIGTLLLVSFLLVF